MTFLDWHIVILIEFVNLMLKWLSAWYGAARQQPWSSLLEMLLQRSVLLLDKITQIRQSQVRYNIQKRRNTLEQTSQGLRMMSSVTINCQVKKIVINPGSQLSVL